MNTTDTSVLVENVTTKSLSPHRDWPPPLSDYGEAIVMMRKVIPPIIISIGTFGNILTMIVLFRHFKRLSSTAMFFLTLAVSDTVILWCGPLRHWFKAILKIDIRTLSDVSCKLQIYLTYVSLHMSSWLLVAVTMERALSVIIPHRIKLLCTPTKASIVIVVITVLVFAIDTFVPIAWNFEVYQNNSYCTTSRKDYSKFNAYYFTWIEFCVGFACPFIILLIGNILIIVKLAKSNLNRVKMNATSGLTKSARKGRSVSVLLVSLCFVYFLTISPRSILNIWVPYRAKEILAITDRYAQWDAYQYFLFQKEFVSYLGSTNASINFLLYVFNGSKFRGDLKALFYCKTPKRNGVFGSRNKKSSTSNTHSYILKSSANVYKLSSEHNQSANKSNDVSDSVRDAMQSDRNVQTNIDGQGQLFSMTNNGHVYFNNALNADDGINHVSITCPENAVKEPTEVTLNNDGQCQLVDTTNNGHVYFNNAFNSDDGINHVSITCTGSDVKEPTEVTSENDAQKIKTIADIVTENEPDDVAMST